jgi:hypothetical protein
MTIWINQYSKDWMKRYGRTATKTIATSFGILVTGRMATGYAIGYMIEG